jgi:hypothetical protein
MKDIDLYALNISTLSITQLTELETSLKILLILVSIGYTIAKWIKLKK